MECVNSAKISAHTCSNASVGLSLPQCEAAPGPHRPRLQHLQLAPLFQYSPVMWPDPEVHLEARIQGLEAQNMPCSLPKGQEELMGTSTC